MTRSHRWSYLWSHIVPVLLGLVLALLPGCGDNRSAGVPAPYQGTWHQFAGADGSAGVAPLAGGAHQVGFIAVGADQVLCDIDGCPRGTFGISSVSGDAGLGSTMLILANGMRLFTSIGHGSCDVVMPDGHLISDCSWLDVHLVRTSASGTDESVARMRLWSSGAVAASTQAAVMRVAAVPAGPNRLLSQSPAGEPQALPTHDQQSISGATLDGDRLFAERVAMTGDQGLVAAARALTRLHGDGDPRVITAQYHALVLALQRELLRLLDQAASGDALALVEANRRAVHLDAFSTAYAAWTRTSQ